MWQWSRKISGGNEWAGTERPWPQHHPRRRGAHDCGRVAEPAVRLGWSERRGLDNQAVVIPGFSYERMMRGTTFLRVVGRLRPGMAVEQARTALPALDQSYRAESPARSIAG